MTPGTHILDDKRDNEDVKATAKEFITEPVWITNIS